MGKLPDNITLVRMDREIWEKWCKFCEHEGFLASKWASKILARYMKDYGWKDEKGKRLIDNMNIALVDKNKDVLSGVSEK